MTLCSLHATDDDTYRKEQSSCLRHPRHRLACESYDERRWKVQSIQHRMDVRSDICVASLAMVVHSHAQMMFRALHPARVCAETNALDSGAHCDHVLPRDIPGVNMGDLDGRASSSPEIISTEMS